MVSLPNARMWPDRFLPKRSASVRFPFVFAWESDKVHELVDARQRAEPRDAVQDLVQLTLDNAARRNEAMHPNPEQAVRQVRNVSNVGAQESVRREHEPR